MIDAYIQLLKEIAANPRTAERPVAEEVSILQIGDLSHNDLKTALRRVDVLHYLHAPRFRKPPEIAQHRMVPLLDHPVNRYVLWRTQQVLRLLKTTEREKLQQALKRTFFVLLRPEPLQNAALLVLINDPHYAKLHRMGLRIIQEYST